MSDVPENNEFDDLPENGGDGDPKNGGGDGNSGEPANGGETSNGGNFGAQGARNVKRPSFVIKRDIQKEKEQCMQAFEVAVANPSHCMQIHQKQLDDLYLIKARRDEAQAEAKAKADRQADNRARRGMLLAVLNVFKRTAPAQAAASKVSAAVIVDDDSRSYVELEREIHLVKRELENATSRHLLKATAPHDAKIEALKQEEAEALKQEEAMRNSPAPSPTKPRKPSDQELATLEAKAAPKSALTRAVEEYQKRMGTGDQPDIGQSRGMRR